MALKYILQDVDIDVAANYEGEPVWAVQNSSGAVGLNVQLNQLGTAIDLSGVDILFRYRTTKGYVGEEVIDENHSSVLGIDRVRGSVRMILPNKALVEHGFVECEFKLSDMVLTIKTPIFRVYVHESIN